MKRKCVKGKSCGKSCISKNRICRVDALEEVSKGLTKVVSEVGSVKRLPKNRNKTEFRGSDLIVDGEKFTPGKKLPGSTQPTLYVDKDGKGSWVVKGGGAEGQNLAEMASQNGYKILGPSLGISAVDSRLVEGKLVNRFISDGRTIDKVSPMENTALKINDRMKKSLIADALVANWDYMGALKGDNVMVDKNGNIYRIDAGGTFNYRAQGANKNFSALPMEYWDLRGRQGKEIWANAKEGDYRNLWVDQIKSLKAHSKELKQSVDGSGMVPEVKRAFSQRVEALTMAGNAVSSMRFNGKTLAQLADQGVVSWRDIDGALKKAFESASGLDPSSSGWANGLKGKISDALSDLVPGG